MSFKENAVKVQGQFPENTTHARFVYEPHHDGPQNNILILVKYLFQLNFPHWYA